MNKFNLLLRQGIYPYEYMVIRKNPMKNHYLKKNIEKYSRLNMEYITNWDYTYAKRVCKDFELKKLGEYHDLYVQSNTLLLTNVFENFRNKRLENIWNWSHLFSYYPRFSMASGLKKRPK